MVHIAFSTIVFQALFIAFNAFLVQSLNVFQIPPKNKTKQQQKQIWPGSS